jgi:hypothetical protein
MVPIELIESHLFYKSTGRLNFLDIDHGIISEKAQKIP